LVMSAVGLAVPNWDITGTWALNFNLDVGGLYQHTMTVTSFNRWTGDFVGTGFYNADPAYTWTVTGTVTSSTVSFHILYTGTNAGYTVDATGELDVTGTSMTSGTWTGPGQTGVWTGTGVAKLIPTRCVKIKEGLLTYQSGHYLAGKPLVLGYDAYGYNYQAHMFDGSYANAYLGKDDLSPYTGDDVAYLAANPDAASKWYWPYRADRVLMKWNDAWLSNMDCNADAKLDRPTDKATYRGSGAWETNHQWGTNIDGTLWNYFVKIVAAPDEANLVGSDWIAADGSLIGYSIWGDFAVTQEVYTDPSTGDHGLFYKSAHPGLGTW